MNSTSKKSASNDMLKRLAQPNTWLLALVAVVVPNLIFLLATPYFLVYRLVSPPLYFLAAMISLWLRPPFVYVLFGLVAIIDLSLVVAVMFYLPLATAFHTIRYLASIDVAASAFYIGAISLFLFNALGTAWLVNRHRKALCAASPLPAAILAAALPVADAYVNRSYVKQPASHFESAMALNGLDAESITKRGRNLLIVIVEGLGSFSDPGMKALLASKFESAAVKAGYSVLSGRSNFEGSTTSAESRELCGRWGNFTDYLRAEQYDCLPRQLAERGFATISYHGYSSEMFDRDVWYPRIGIKESHFLDDLARDRQLFPSRCGSVFNGLCDGEVGDAVHLRLLAKSAQPMIVYWLTLNSHIPYVAKPGGQLHCRTNEAIIKNQRVCELTEIWAEVFDKISEIAADPKLPSTDILVVGDHTTPLWEKRAAVAFTPGKVDWYFLQTRQSAQTQLTNLSRP